MRRLAVSLAVVPSLRSPSSPPARRDHLGGRRRGPEARNQKTPPTPHNPSPTPNEILHRQTPPTTSRSQVFEGWSRAERGGSGRSRRWPRLDGGGWLGSPRTAHLPFHRARAALAEQQVFTPSRDSTPDECLIVPADDGTRRILVRDRRHRHQYSAARRAKPARRSARSTTNTVTFELRSRSQPSPGASIRQSVSIVSDEYAERHVKAGTRNARNRTDRNRGLLVRFLSKGFAHRSRASRIIGRAPPGRTTASGQGRALWLDHHRPDGALRQVQAGECHIARYTARGTSTQSADRPSPS